MFFEKIFYSIFYDFKKHILKKKKLVWVYVQPFQQYTKRTEFLTHKLKKIVNRFRMPIDTKVQLNKKISFSFFFLLSKFYLKRKLNVLLFKKRKRLIKNNLMRLSFSKDLIKIKKFFNFVNRIKLEYFYMFSKGN